MFALVAMGAYSVLTWPAGQEDRFPIDTKEPLAVHGTIVHGEAVYNYHSLSDHLAERLPFTQLFGISSVDPSSIVEAIIPDLAAGRDLALPLGVTCILAPTGWGKTVLVEEFITPALIDSDLSPVVINYVEPFSATAAEATDYIGSPVALLARLGVALMLGETLVVDSLRAFVYGKGRGGTGSKGVDQLLYPQLTALSNAAIASGSRLVLTLNPMVTLEEVERYDEFANAIVSSVAGALVGSEGRRGEFFDRGPITTSREDARIAIAVPDHSAIRARKRRRLPDWAPLTDLESPVSIGDPPTTLAQTLVGRSLSNIAKDNN